jgi:hypothetical protein
VSNIYVCFLFSVFIPLLFVTNSASFFADSMVTLSMLDAMRREMETTVVPVEEEGRPQNEEGDVPSEDADAFTT